MTGSLPDDVAASLKKDFEGSHPGVTVEYQVQQWDGIGEKLTTALAGDQPPDVLEIGNTQVAQYAAAGGLTDLSDAVGTFENSDSWLPGLAEPGKWEGKTYGVPFYAGTRTVIYRTDLFEQAGVAVPTTWDELLALGEPLRAAFGAGNPQFMPLYLPGQQWYTLASLVWDEGGELAVPAGEGWKGALATPQGQAGIARYQQLYSALSTAPADTDEATPQQYEILSQSGAAMMIGLPWELASAVEAAPELDGKLGVFALPSKTAGKLAPPFVGGSDLAVPLGSDAPDLAKEFIGLVAGTDTQTALAEAGAIPNSSALAGVAADNEVLQTGIEAAAVGRATPVDPTWASVETAPNPLKDMLTQVLQGVPVQQAAAAADDLITERMSS
ncbi:extracellular solute-binding protein [Pseudonocardia lacus]|uniref:extracellular solute-binding protein n=1 Tax=Pseudonocardia lacus TaxID=2835865 RepID=UPI00202950AD|nr:extracellular solute-binding protein [Pseudonocardia lacus]